MQNTAVFVSSTYAPFHRALFTRMIIWLPEFIFVVFQEDIRESFLISNFSFGLRIFTQDFFNHSVQGAVASFCQLLFSSRIILPVFIPSKNRKSFVPIIDITESLHRHWITVRIKFCGRRVNSIGVRSVLARQAFNRAEAVWQFRIFLSSSHNTHLLSGATSHKNGYKNNSQAQNNSSACKTAPKMIQ